MCQAGDPRQLRPGVAYDDHAGRLPQTVARDTLAAQVSALIPLDVPALNHAFFRQGPHSQMGCGF